MRFNFQAQAFLTICLTVNYGDFQPIESSKDDVTVVSVVTSKSIIDHQIKSEDLISKNESPITEASIVDMLIKSSKKEIIAALVTTTEHQEKSTLISKVTTVKSETTTEEEDEDYETVNPDYDENPLATTCITSFQTNCRSGR